MYYKTELIDNTGEVSFSLEEVDCSLNLRAEEINGEGKVSAYFNKNQLAFLIRRLQEFHKELEIAEVTEAMPK